MRGGSHNTSWVFQTFVAATCCFSCLTFSGAHAAVDCDKLLAIQKKYHISAADMKALGCEAASAASPKIALGRAVDAPSAILHPDKSAAPAPTTSASSPTKPSTANGWAFLLRQNWTDIGLLASPTTVHKATGATASFSNDLVAANRSWAVDGTVAVVYTGIDDEGPTQTTPFYQSLAAYASVNKLYNSNPKLVSKNVDTVGGGAAAELGFRNAAAESEQYFQFRAGGVTDNIKNTTSLNGTAAWIPVAANYNIHAPAQLFGTIRFDRSLQARI